MRRRRRQRGAAMVGFAVLLTVFTAIAVVGVDVGRLAFTATEVQTVADVAATAGARALVEGGDAVAAAQLAVGENMVDRQVAAIAPPGSVEPGHYSDGAFTAGAEPFNAVRANADHNVTNFLGAILGTPQTLVQKTATASYITTGSGEPGLPFALSECYFPPECMDQSCLPEAITTPSTGDNAGWTGLFGNADTQTILSYFPSPCGGGGEVPTIKIGDEITLNNGETSPLFRAVRCLVCDPTIGRNEFLVPIVAECNDNFNQTSQVTGIATIKIDQFVFQTGPPRLCEGYNPNNPNAGQAPTQIVLSAVFRADVPGGPGGAGTCTGCGTGYIALVN